MAKQEIIAILQLKIRAIKLNLNCYILCAPDYAEESIIQATFFLQASGIKHFVLGLKKDAVSGTSCTNFSVDILISECFDSSAKTPPANGLLLPGGERSGQQLLADPRVHLLVDKMVSKEKPVGFLSPVSFALFNLLSQKSVSYPFLLQERLETGKFIDDFVEKIYRFNTFHLSH